LLLAANTQNDGRATSQLFAALYDELHRLAERQLRRNGGKLSLSTTTLLHEAYLDMCGRAGTAFPDRARFIGYAARAMRGIVIDYIRYGQAQKRGGGAIEITLTAAREIPTPTDSNSAADFERLSEALDQLAELEPQLAEVVDLHFFCGYELREIAELRGVSERTVQRSWRKARMLLSHHMSDALSATISKA
jgi:RNA polymerase sigma factor (TIGR02999 family)